MHEKENNFYNNDLNYINDSNTFQITEILNNIKTDKDNISQIYGDLNSNENYIFKEKSKNQTFIKNKDFDEKFDLESIQIKTKALLKNKRNMNEVHYLNNNNLKSKNTIDNNLLNKKEYIENENNMYFDEERINKLEIKKIIQNENSTNKKRKRKKFHYKKNSTIIEIKKIN